MAHKDESPKDVYARIKDKIAATRDTMRHDMQRSDEYFLLHIADEDVYALRDLYFGMQPVIRKQVGFGDVRPKYMIEDTALVRVAKSPDTEEKWYIVVPAPIRGMDYL